MTLRYELMTDAELKFFLAKYDMEMRKASQNGPALDDAEQKWKLVMREIERRKA